MSWAELSQRRAAAPRLRSARMRPILVQIEPQLSLNQTRVIVPAAAAVGQTCRPRRAGGCTLLEIGATAHALAPIASIWELPEPVLVVRETETVTVTETE